MFASSEGFWRWRYGTLAALLLLEALIVSIVFDTKSLIGKTGPITHLVERGAPYAMRFSLVFAVTAALWLYLREASPLQQIGTRFREHAPFSPRWLTVHTILFSGAFLLSNTAFQRNGSTVSTDVLIVLVAVLGFSSLAALALSFIPARMLSALWIVARKTIALAAGCGALTVLLSVGTQRLWTEATKSTFFLVEAMLSAVVSDVVSTPATADIGTKTFSVTIAKECSGLEGAGLFLVFGSAGLLLFRKDFRFPNALVLLPLGVSVLFLLNAVRITLLILIGHAGYENVAVGGFHSQAGWIFFNGVTLGLFTLARRLAFFAHTEPQTSNESTYDAAPYLMPFLAIMSIGMFTRAASAGFEWLYPIRLLGCAFTLWLFRQHYRGMQWRFGGFAATVGFAVFVIWVGFDWISPMKESGMPKELASISAMQRTLWIFLRIAAACVTVPIAEELAFRAFPFSNRSETASGSWAMLAASSLLFGMLHGDRWIVGTVAGLFYAWVYLRKGRIGDPVAAHAITNGLLAAYVLLTGSWRFW